jgi:questin oxidase-like protein
LSRYYDAYLNYFSEYLRDHTPNEAFERFVLSSSSNFDPDLLANDVQDIKKFADKGKKHPEMLNRLLAGLLHPFIHALYGFEFGLSGQVAEGSSIFGSAIYDSITEDTIRPCMCRRPQSRTD